MAYFIQPSKAYTITDNGLSSTHIVSNEELAIQCHLQHFSLESLSFDADITAQSISKVDPLILCTSPRCQKLIHNDNEQKKSYQGWNDNLELDLFDEEDFLDLL